MSIVGSSIDGLIPLLYYISSPLLVIAALLALRQISVAKRDLKTRSTREAILLACVQIEKYATEIVPMENKLYDNVKPEEFYYTARDFVDFDAQNSVRIPEAFLKARLALHKESAILSSDILNRYEALACPFIARIADEQTAYESMGFSYCYSISGLAYEITMQRDFSAFLYRSAVTLYKLWKLRLERETTKGKREEIIAKYRKIPNRSIFPIGTE